MSRSEASAESVVRAYWERVWLERDLDALEQLVTDPVVRHTAEGTESLALLELRRRLTGAFETVRATEVSIDAVCVDSANSVDSGDNANGSIVWIRLTLRGVSLATAAPMSLAWLAQYRIEDGRIAELWALHQPGADWSEQ